MRVLRCAVCDAHPCRWQEGGRAGPWIISILESSAQAVLPETESITAVEIAQGLKKS